MHVVTAAMTEPAAVVQHQGQCVLVLREGLVRPSVLRILALALAPVVALSVPAVRAEVTHGSQASVRAVAGTLSGPSGTPIHEDFRHGSRGESVESRKRN